MAARFSTQALCRMNELPIVRVLFETHATSIDNEAGLASGSFDVALSSVGEEQARARSASVVNMMTSPLCSVRIFSEPFARQTLPSMPEGYS
jgi:hypothetical protein